MLVKGKERQCVKDVPSSNRKACAKALGKEGTQYMLRADRSSMFWMWLENRVKERKRCGGLSP